MAVTVEAIIAGTTYALSGGNPFYHVSMLGIGAPPLRRQQERGPFQHGTTDLGVLLDPRVISLVLFFQADTLAQADTHRDTLMEIFKPVYDPAGNPAITLRVTRDDGEVRQIDGHSLGPVDMPNTFDQERMGTSQRFGVQLYCPDPVWHSETTTNLVARYSGLGFQIPLVVPWVSEAEIVSATENAIYDGTWPEYPIIEITGPITDCVITNLTTGDVLNLTGTTIAGGVTWTLDLRYGYKTVVDGSGVNQVAALSADSDLATWSLVPAPTAPGGSNTIQFEGTGATTATLVVIRYYNRYIAL